MRVTYNPHGQRAWEDFFRVQGGHGLVGYRGTAYQRGAGIGNLLGGLLRSFLPVAKTIGKTVGKQALRTGAEVAADALSGRNIGESLQERGKLGATKLLVKGVKKLDKKPRKNNKGKKRKTQKGRGFGIRSKTKSTTGRSLKAVSRKKKLHTDQLGVYVA